MSHWDHPPITTLSQSLPQLKTGVGRASAAVPNRTRPYQDRQRPIQALTEAKSAASADMAPVSRNRSAYVGSIARVLAAVAVLAGCTVGPDFEHPAGPTADRFTKDPLPGATNSAAVA